MPDDHANDSVIDPYAALAAGNTTSQNAKVVYARDPDPTKETQTAELAAMNCFPMYSTAQALARLGQTVARNMGHNDAETVQGFQDIASQLGDKIKNYPAYSISLAYCSPKQAKVVKDFSAGKFIKENTNATMRAALEQALAKGTILS